MQDDQVEKAKILDVCPQLDSLINEVLRLTVASALAREIESPFELGGKILQPGNALLVSCATSLSAFILRSYFI